MDFNRRIIQFNDFTFGSTSGTSFSSNFLQTSTDYGFSSGSSYGYEQGVSSTEYTVIFSPRFIVDDPIENTMMVRWMKRQLQGLHRLWAIDYDNTLIYCDALVVSLQYSNDNPIDWQIVFKNVSGVWIKADKTVTFIKKICDRELYWCETHYTECIDNIIATCDCTKCACDIEGSLICDDYDKLITCDSDYRVVVDCALGETTHGDIAKLGVGIPLEYPVLTTTTLIAYEGEIPTQNIIITLTGSWVNPEIVINGMVFMLNYTNNGEITLNFNKNLYFSDNIDDLSAFIVSDIDRFPLFTLGHEFKNYIKIKGYQDSQAKAYIKYSLLTY